MKAELTRPEEKGSSLIEALLALSILAMVLVFLFGAIGSFNNLNTRNQTRSYATAAARARLEQLRFADPATLPTTGSDTTLMTVGLYDFTILTQYCSTATYCDANTRHVVVNVQDQGQDVFSTETVFTQLR